MALIITGVIFQLISNWLTKHSSAPPEDHKPTPKGAIGAFCFLVYFSVSGAVPEQVYSQNPAFFLGPIVFAVLLYQTLVHYLHGLPGLLPIIGPRMAAIRDERQSKLRQERIDRHECPACGYDVRQTLHDKRETCPECGSELEGVPFPRLLPPFGDG